MDFYQAVYARKTIRAFDPRPVEPDKLRRVLEAGLQAPTHNHLREWEFIQVPDPAVRFRLVEGGERLEELVDRENLEKSLNHLEGSARTMYLDAIPRQKRMLLDAPELLVVAYRTSKPVAECQKIYELNGLASVWCCIENILLAMAAEGLYGVTYIPQNTPKLRELLELPENYEIPAILPLGYPAETARRAKQKPVRLEDKLHVNRFRKKMD
jgi:nitroreductase